MLLQFNAVAALKPFAWSGTSRTRALVSWCRLLRTCRTSSCLRSDETGRTDTTAASCGAASDGSIKLSRYPGDHVEGSAVIARPSVVGYCPCSELRNGEKAWRILAPRHSAGHDRDSTNFHFGRRVGSPPGLPGGGMIGMGPPSGVGALMSGSTLGGQRTPSVRSNFSLRVWLEGSRGCNAVPLPSRKRCSSEHAFGSGVSGARGV